MTHSPNPLPWSSEITSNPFAVCCRMTCVSEPEYVPEDFLFLFYISLFTLDKLILQPKIMSEATIRHILDFNCSILFKRTRVVNICLALTFFKGQTTDLEIDPVEMVLNIFYHIFFSQFVAQLRRIFLHATVFDLTQIFPCKT